MRCVVLESPYSDNNGMSVEDNVAYAKRCIFDCLLRGEAPIASHLLYTQPGILDDNQKLDRAKGIAAGHAWIKHADAVVVYRDLGLSPGMKKGIIMANYYDVPVEERYLDEKNVPQQDVRVRD